MKKMIFSALIAGMMMNSVTMLFAVDEKSSVSKVTSIFSMETIKSAFTKAKDTIVGLPQYAKDHPYYFGTGLTATAAVGLFIMYKKCPWFRNLLGLDDESKGVRGNRMFLTEAHI